MRKIIPLMALVSSVACGDTNYYMNESGDGSGDHAAYTCKEVADKLVYCGIIDAPKDMLSDCKKGLWENKEATEADMACVMESPCEYLTNWKTEGCINR